MEHIKLKDVKGVWKGVLAQIKQEISPEDFRLWFQNIEPLRLEEERFIIGVENSFFGDWFLKNHRETLQEKLSEFFAKKIVISYEQIQLPAREKKQVYQTLKKEVPKTSYHHNKSKNNRVGGTMNFDNFIVGDSNDLVYAFAQMIADDPFQTGVNPFFIYGNTGLGKTHLLHSIVNQIKQKKNNLKVQYISSDNFLNEYIEVVVNKKFKQFRHKYRGLDVLLIDDVQFFERKQKFQEEFFHTFNELVSLGKQIVITSDKKPKDLAGLEKRLVSRFENGQVVEILPPDYETRRAIIVKKAQEKNLFLEEEIIDYLANHIKSNVRPLEGAINRLAFFSSLRKKQISLEKCHELITPVIDKEKLRQVSLAEITEKVAKYYNLDVSSLIKKDKKDNIATVRQIAMYLSRTMTDKSFPAIGQYFQRNHSTISHACKKVQSRLVYDKEFSKSIENLKSLIN